GGPRQRRCLLDVEPLGDERRAQAHGLARRDLFDEVAGRPGRAGQGVEAERVEGGGLNPWWPPGWAPRSFWARRRPPRPRAARSAWWTAVAHGTCRRARRSGRRPTGRSGGSRSATGSWPYPGSVPDGDSRILTTHA